MEARHLGYGDLTARGLATSSVAIACPAMHSARGEFPIAGRPRETAGVAERASAATAEGSTGLGLVPGLDESLVLFAIFVGDQRLTLRRAPVVTAGSPIMT